MKSVVVAVAIVALGILVCSWFGAETSKQLMQGELRCEGAGGVVINIGGKDYAVNAMAGPHSFMVAMAALASAYRLN